MEHQYICDHKDKCGNNRCPGATPFTAKEIGIASVLYPGKPGALCNLDFKVKAIPYHPPAKKYRLLKSVSIRSLVEAQEDLRCEEFWEELNRLFYCCCRNSLEIREIDLFLHIFDNPKVRDWLLSHGFIAEDEDLKPCPFCGSTDVEIRKATWFYVFCKTCFVCGPGCDTKSEAREKWANGR